MQKKSKGKNKGNQSILKWFFAGYYRKNHYSLPSITQNIYSEL